MGAIVNAPVIIDVGKTSRGDIRDLKEGHGQLLDDVNQAMGQVANSLGSDAEGKHLIPVVLIYRKKQRDKDRDSFLPLRLPLIG